MYILYQPNGFCFKTKLKEEMWSDTSIKNQLWKYHYVFSCLLEDTMNYDKDYIQWSYTKHKKILTKSEVFGKQMKFATSIIDDMVRWKVLIRSRINKNNFTTTNGFNVSYSTDVFVKFYDEFIQNGFSEWTDTTVKHGIKQQLPNSCYHVYRETKNGNTSPLTGVYKQLADNLSLVTIDAVAARKFAYEAMINKMPLKNKTKGHVLIKDRVVDQRVYSNWLMVINAIELRWSS